MSCRTMRTSVSHHIQCKLLVHMVRDEKLSTMTTNIPGRRSGFDVGVCYLSDTYLRTDMMIITFDELACSVICNVAEDDRWVT